MKNLLVDENGNVASLRKHDLSLRGVGRGTEEESFRVKSGKVLVFGDLHLSAKYEGTHKDYSTNCIRVMQRILNIVENEKSVSAVFFLGDVFGVKERNVQDPAFWMLMVSFFQQLNSMTSGRVFTVRGNHDYGDCPEFYRFEQLGLIKNPDYVDILNPSGGTELRFHIVNYGNESRELTIADGVDASNVVLAHNDFEVPGKTAWYGGSSIKLTTHTPFMRVNMVISGHIHTPSEEVIDYTIGSDEGDVKQLFYPGCPTRVSERYDECFYCVFEYNDADGSTVFDAKEFGLWPASEEFHAQKGTVDEVAAESTVENLESLARMEEILSDLRETNLFVGNPEDQIKAVPETPQVVKDIALDYLSRAMELV